VSAGAFVVRVRDRSGAVVGREAVIAR
jgi:hypothetical protein